MAANTGSSGSRAKRSSDFVYYKEDTDDESLGSDDTLKQVSAKKSKKRPSTKKVRVMKKQPQRMHGRPPFKVVPEDWSDEEAPDPAHRPQKVRATRDNVGFQAVAPVKTGHHLLEPVVAQDDKEASQQVDSRDLAVQELQAELGKLRNENSVFKSEKNKADLEKANAIKSHVEKKKEWEKREKALNARILELECADVPVLPAELPVATLPTDQLPPAVPEQTHLPPTMPPGQCFSHALPVNQQPPHMLPFYQHPYQIDNTQQQLMAPNTQVPQFMWLPGNPFFDMNGQQHLGFAPTNYFYN